MRWPLLMGICAALGGGCSGVKDPGYTASETPPSALQGSATAPASEEGAPAVIVTPDMTLSGRVAMINPNARYAILSFPIGSLPAVGTHMDVYRKGLKVGELRITGPQRDFSIAADITAGECREGDEVREH